MTLLKMDYLYIKKKRLSAGKVTPCTLLLVNECVLNKASQLRIESWEQYLAENCSTPLQFNIIFCSLRLS
ncbi:hypothetical protein ANCCAN_23683 [Ancylostoma caninum]|uniref:Uncharacterized protein n=1 Tax=Ancylostoma caninum TaxID=29170 RepID=A0A368FIA0_ANCCA|nr:hypothetical protein ANCCAN_23683 [Ancylostoma caninum]